MARDVARIGLTLIGGYVGGMFGYPQLGLFLGGLVGNAIFPQKLPGVTGPRLGDLSVQTSTIGVAVPRTFGTFMVAGNVIWSSGLIETVHKEEVGGKGGPTQKVTTYSYRASLAIGLCEGVKQGYLRIWADSKLIFDRRPQGYSETSEIFGLRIAGSDLIVQKLTFYGGTEDQLPDPTIESYEGAGNVQAFRGLCYIVLTDFELEDYGNRIPNFRVEVYEQGEEGCEDVTEYSNDVLLPWIDADTPLNGYNEHEFTVAEVGHGYAGAGRNLGPYSTLGEAIAAASNVSGRGYDYYSGYRTLRGDDAGVVNRIGAKTVADYDVQSVWMHFSSYEYDIQVNRYTNPYGTALSDYMRESQGHTLGNRRWSNGQFSQSSWGPGGAVYLAIPHGQSLVPAGYDWIVTGPHDPGGGTYHAVALDCLIKATRVPRGPSNLCDPGLFGSLPSYGENFCILPNGTLEPAVPWTRVEDEDSTCLRATRYGSAAKARTIVTSYPLNPCLPDNHPNDTQAFWEAAYNAAVLRGEIEAGLVWNVDYPERIDHYWTRSYTQCTAAADPVTLASIVRAICESCGLDPYADIDVADLEPILVHGYAVARTMSGRDMIEPLRAYGFFDAVESGGVLKFVTRGKAAVATLEAEDLGAYVSGGERPAAVLTDRKLEFEMPRAMRVHYARPHADYEPGQQDSSRQATSSAHLADVEIPVAMTDARAQQIAEVLHYDAWAGRNSYETSLDLALLRLEPTDCVLVPVDGQLERMRIEGADHHLPSLMRFDLVRDDDGSYTSYAVGIPGEQPESDMGFVGPSGVVLLDIPALRDEDDDAGYYAAVRPLITSSAWRGAAIFRSADGGASFTQIGASTTAAAMGQVLSALPAGPHEVWDEGNTLVVELYTGSLEGRTEEAVLNGANAAAIGVDGRWEIIQFRDASLSAGVWSLTGLLRGRRGTEWAIGDSVAGDTFVLLSDGGIARLPLENAAIGAVRHIKVVTLGEAFDASEGVEEFTGHGVALEPFSPVFVVALRQDDGDITIRWIRRGRLSQELRDGADIPLSEATEAYEVDVLIAGVVVRTIETTVQSAEYTLAQQATDFGSPLPAELTLRIYQLSAIVGRGYPAEVTVAVGDVPDFVSGPSTFDTDAIIFTGEARETDVNGILSWTRQGDGPRLSGSGFVGDGYEALYEGTSLPGWLASSGNAVTLRATVECYHGPRNATRDVAVHLGNDDATANPKIQLACIDEVNGLADEFQMAVRVFTGSMQTQRMNRRNWRFEFSAPVKEIGGLDVRVQALAVLEDLGQVLLATHVTGGATGSQCYLVDRATGDLAGQFTFGPSTALLTGCARRDSDESIWLADFDTGDISRIDLEASLAAGVASVDLTFTVSADDVLNGIAWIEHEGVEYLLAQEYRTSGTAYLYVIDPADVTNGGTFNAADRIIRIETSLQIKGVAYFDGRVYLSRTGTSDGITYVIDFAAALAGADSAAYTAYLLDTIPSSANEGTGMDFDSGGRLWQASAGESVSGTEQEFFAAWSSGLGWAEANTYQVRYDGAGSVEIKINDRLFITRSWTPTITPATLAIGGPPATAASQTAGYFSGRVRSVVVQSSDLDLNEGYVPVVYDDVAPDSWDFGLENPGAEDGTTGWTVEAGTLAVFTDTDIVAGWVDPKFGDQAFYGGNVALSTVRQRFDLETITEVPAADLEEAGLDAWVLLEWWAAGFGSQGDYATAGVRFLDEDSVEISETMAPALVISPNNTFAYRSFSVEVPAGTRFIDVLVDMVRTDGTENNGHWEEIAATLLRAPL